MSHKTSLVIVMIIIICMQTFGGATPEENEWLQWRGPMRNGTSEETKWDTNALDEPEEVWRIDIGSGHSSPVIQGKYVYVMGSQRKADVLYCLNAKNGSTVWEFVNAIDEQAAPFSTPLIDGDYVYAVGTTGDLLCLEKRSGKLIWVKNLVTDYHVDRPMNGWCVSPLVSGNLLIANAGSHGIAVDKSNGELVWGLPGTGAYAAPVVFENDGDQYVALVGADKLHVVNLDAGEPVWSTLWFSNNGNNAVDPVVFNNKLFASKKGGSALFDLSSGVGSPVWESAAIRSYFSSWVYVDGYLYGNNGSQKTSYCEFICVDASNGDVAWRIESKPGQLIAVGGQLVMLTDRGRIAVVAADPNEYREYSAAELDSVRGKIWAPPVFCNNRIFIRTAAGILIAIIMG